MFPTCSKTLNKRNVCENLFKIQYNFMIIIGGMAVFGVQVASLVTLTIVNSLQTVLVRYARSRAGDMFFGTVAVVLAELVKCLTSTGCFKSRFPIKNVIIFITHTPN